MKLGDRTQTALLVIGGLTLFLLGIYTFTQARGGYLGAVGYGLLGIAFLIAGSLLLTIPLSRALSNPFGSLFFPEQKFKRAQPLYSFAESLVKKMKYTEAMAAYEKIAQEYPEEVKPWIDMIDIAIVHHRDADEANRIFQRGIAALTDPDSRDTLSRMYRGIRSQIAEKKDWQKTRTLSIDPRVHEPVTEPKRRLPTLTIDPPDRGPTPKR